MADDLTIEDMEGYRGMQRNNFQVLLAVAEVALKKLQKQKAGAAPETPPPPPPSPPQTTARISQDAGEGPSSAPSKKRKKMLSPPPPLPQEFKNAIQELGDGKNLTDPVLVIQKSLYESDLKANQNRLSMPLSQITSEDFLTEREKNYLCGRNEKDGMNFMEVKMIQPSLALETVLFRRWVMEKGNGKGKGKTSTSYVINGKWKDVVKNNNLKVGMEVQLWCFRVNQDLHFALVILPQ